MTLEIGGNVLTILVLGLVGWLIDRWWTYRSRRRP